MPVAGAVIAQLHFDLCESLRQVVLAAPVNDVEDFGAAYARMQAAGVRFLGEPRTEPYGQVVVFVDIAGNKWDLIG